MKRLLISVFLSLPAAPLALASPDAFYINTFGVSVVAPPQAAPVIDAISFVNNSYFDITNLYPQFSVTPPVPFETWDTLNWSNRNLMMGDPGFRFDDFDSGTSLNKRSAYFVNANTVAGSNDIAKVFGASYLLVSATNIINRGALTISGAGLLTLEGENVDLTRGLVAGVGNESSSLAGVLDWYWGVGTNNLNAFFGANVVQSSPLLCTTIQFPFYVPFFQSLLLTNFTTYMQTNLFGTNQTVDVLFLSNTNPAISTEVRFGGGEKVVQWQSILTNRATGTIMTNLIYLSDRTFLYPALVQTPKPNPAYTLLSAATFHPANYAITHSFPGFTNLTQMSNQVVDPLIFQGRGTPIFVTNTGYGATLTAQAFSVDPYISGSTFTNVPGRIEIVADKVLDLTRTRIDGESYLRLATPNHFAGSTNAEIISPFSDIDLATTNGSMTIANLLTPTVPRMAGTIEVWSGNWTNSTATLSTLYQVTVVDSRLVQEVPSQIQDLTLHATNLFISDILNVFRTLLLDTERLTITTNPPGSPTLTGELNLTSGDIFWAPSFPRLQYLTNFGKITVSNTVFFAGARRPPWFSGSFDEPYQAFVNHGLVASVGMSTWALYYENTGTNAAVNGPIIVQANTALVTDGSFLAPGGDISFTSGSLVISNEFVQAGRSLTLTITNLLDDGSLANNCADFVTNKNTWTTGDGLNLPMLPPLASLLGTTVTNTAAAYANVMNVWAALDRGAVPEGYPNNAGLGRLILDGGQNSLFTFTPANGHNAIYVDYLEFDNYATNTDTGGTDGNWIGINIAPGMTIYYAQAFENGFSIAEKLDGKYGYEGANGGQFRWVSNYNCGFYSSTNMVYADGSTNRVNTALAQSCNIDSGGVTDSNGFPIANCHNPSPIPPAQLQTCCMAVAGNPTANNGAGGSTNGAANSSGAYTLELPATASPTGVLPNGFALAKGSYNGLFADTNGVTAFSSGYFTATTTERKSFTARITIGNRTWSISGLFDSQGRATKTNLRNGARTLTVYLQLDLSGGGQIRGRITDGAWSADLLADRKANSSAALAGSYTMRIPAAVSSNGPGGDGFGTVKVDAHGVVQWTGTLADGGKASQTSTVSKDGFWPLYASLYGGGGSILSWVQFATQPHSDLEGQLIWLKAAGPGTKPYARGFTNDVAAAGALYKPAAAGARRVDLVFSGGGLHGPFTNSISLGLNNKIAGPYSNKLTLSITTSSGLFKGSALNPETGKAFPFQGVLLGKLNIGAGFFMNADQSGQVFLNPAP